MNFQKLRKIVDQDYRIVNMCSARGIQNM